MRLHWSPRSPFVRKVMIVLHEIGQAERVELMRTPVAFARVPPAEILGDNPLGKVPTLVLDSGEALYDSPVICAYLDGQHSGVPLVPPGEAGLRHRRWEALGDGISEMLLQWQLERIRPGGVWAEAVAGLDTKLRAAMDRVATDVGELRATDFGHGQIALFCALGQLEFRFGDSRWREAWPEVSMWFDVLSERPSIQAAPLVDEGDAPSRSGGGVDPAPLDFLASPRGAAQLRS